MLADIAAPAQDWNWHRTIEPFDHAAMVLEDVIVVDVPDIDVPTERAQQIVKLCDRAAATYL